MSRAAERAEALQTGRFDPDPETDKQLVAVVNAAWEIDALVSAREARAAFLVAVGAVGSLYSWLRTGAGLPERTLEHFSRVSDRTYDDCMSAVWLAVQERRLVGVFASLSDLLSELHARVPADEWVGPEEGLRHAYRSARAA